MPQQTYIYRRKCAPQDFCSIIRPKYFSVYINNYVKHVNWKMWHKQTHTRTHTYSANKMLNLNYNGTIYYKIWNYFDNVYSVHDITSKSDKRPKCGAAAQVRMEKAREREKKQNGVEGPMWKKLCIAHIKYEGIYSIVYGNHKEGYGMGWITWNIVIFLFFFFFSREE